MKYGTLDKSKQEELAKLFTAVFTSSEGEVEGRLVGNLASVLASSVDDEEVICFGAQDNKLLIGSIFFTRLQFEQPVQVYMLAPVAVSTEHHGKGIGQKLINFGLDELRKRAVEVVVTYGDPAFYSKTGFEALPQSVIQAPQKLSMPFGWLGQSLTEAPIPAIDERPGCVEAFDDPAYW